MNILPFNFSCSIRVVYECQIMEPSKCSVLVWVVDIDLPQNTIVQKLAGKQYIQIGY